MSDFVVGKITAISGPDWEITAKDKSDLIPFAFKQKGEVVILSKEDHAKLRAALAAVKRVEAVIEELKNYDDLGNVQFGGGVDYAVAELEAAIKEDGK